MKRLFIMTILITGIVAAYSFADMEEHMKGSGMMGSPGYGKAEEPGKHKYPLYGMMGPGMMGYGGYGGYGMMGRGMMGYGGYGMGPGMMGYGMAPGMMGYGGCGMMSPGMMGYGGYGMGSGMMGGMMGHHGMMHGMGQGMMGYGAKEYQMYLDDTVDLRRNLHNKKFEYSEALRNPDTTRETVAKLEKEIWELQKEIYEKQRK